MQNVEFVIVQVNYTQNNFYKLFFMFVVLHFELWLTIYWHH